MYVKVAILCEHFERVTHRTFEEKRTEFLKSDHFAQPLTKTNFLRLVAPDDWRRLTGGEPWTGKAEAKSGST
jgi:hypothetical protein